jgi:hypothetical protein
LSRLESDKAVDQRFEEKTMTSADLSHLDSATAFAADNQGRRVLVGLTYEETQEHIRYIMDRDSGADTPGQVRRNRELHGKHEVARHLLIIDNGGRIASRTLH